MLILTRRPAQSIKIGDDITITICDVKGNHVRVGIDAPRHLAVDREEIAAEKRQGRSGNVK